MYLYLNNESIAFIAFVFQRYKTTVLRRYNDFVAFHELLMIRYPYRLVPRLPPKKMMGGKYLAVVFS